MGYRGNMRKKILIIVVLIVIIIGFIYVIDNGEAQKLYSKKFFLMDTTVEIKVSDSKEAKKIVDSTIDLMEDWAVKLDHYNEDSLVRKINEMDGKDVSLSSDFYYLLEEIVKYAELTDGAFDPTISPLIDLWGFGNGSYRVPTSAEIKERLELVDYRALKIDQKANSISLPASMEIDLGAAAKGFIIDRAYDYLKKQGIDSFFINAGGNIRVSGENRIKNRPWIIGIRRPRSQNKVYKDYILEFSQGGLATSGDYERYFIEDNIRYSHLIDPRTGYPARELQAVTIYAPDALTADIISTAVFISGWEKGKKIIENLPKIAGFLVRDGEIWYSDNFKTLFVRN